MSARRSRGTGRSGGAGAAAAAGALALSVGALAGGGLPVAAAAQPVVTQQEALRLAFPEPAAIERRTAFLDSADLARAREAAGPGVEVEGTVVTYYVGSRRDSALGVAYFDAHRVRTLQEVLMVVVTPEGRVDRVEVLSFGEPGKYRPPDGWLGELEGMALSPRLVPGRDVVNITGATLTSRAVTRAVRRVLALHRVIAPLGRGDGAAAGDAAADAGDGSDGGERR